MNRVKLNCKYNSVNVEIVYLDFMVVSSTASWKLFNDFFPYLLDLEAE